MKTRCTVGKLQACGKLILELSEMKNLMKKSAVTIVDVGCETSDVGVKCGCVM